MRLTSSVTEGGACDDAAAATSSVPAKPARISLFNSFLSKTVYLFTYRTGGESYSGDGSRIGPPANAAARMSHNWLTEPEGRCLIQPPGFLSPVRPWRPEARSPHQQRKSP